MYANLEQLLSSSLRLKFPNIYYVDDLCRLTKIEHFNVSPTFDVESPTSRPPLPNGCTVLYYSGKLMQYYISST